MPHFLSSDGFLYPCCFVYTNKHELIEWAKQNNTDIDDLNIKNHKAQDIKNSDFMKKFNKSFNIDTCRRECGRTSYSTTVFGQPKWENYKTNK